MLESRGAGADRPDEELDLASVSFGVRDGVRAAQIGSQAPRDLEHHELSGRDFAREEGSAEGHGKEAGGEDAAAEEDGPVVGPHAAKVSGLSRQVIAPYPSIRSPSSSSPSFEVADFFAQRSQRMTPSISTKGRA